MTSDARRAHLRVGAATVSVFLLFLLVAVAHGGANSSSGVEKANQSAPEQSAPLQPDPSDPYGGGGFYRRHDGGRFRGGPPGGGVPGGDSSL
jgi:hypothetical protein